MNASSGRRQSIPQALAGVSRSEVEAHLREQFFHPASNLDGAYIPTQAREVLKRFDERSQHYEIPERLTY